MPLPAGGTSFTRKSPAPRRSPGEHGTDRNDNPANEDGAMKTRTGMALAAAVVTLGLGAAEASANFHQHHRSRATVVVDAWYRKYLGRPIDPYGQRVYVPAVLAAAQPYETEAVLLSGEEYFRRCGHCPRRFVLSLYRDACGVAAPSPFAVNYWVAELERSGCRRSVALRLIHEHRCGVGARVPMVEPMPVIEPVVVPVVVPAYQVPAYAPPSRSGFQLNIRIR